MSGWKELSIARELDFLDFLENCDSSWGIIVLIEVIVSL
jgi:hypothetical protein